MAIRRGNLTEIATDMISRQRTEGVVKKRLGRGLWVSWTGERLSLSRGSQIMIIFRKISIRTTVRLISHRLTRCKLADSPITGLSVILTLR